MPDYPTILEIVQFNDLVLLLAVTVCVAITIAGIRVNDRWLLKLGSVPVLYLPRPTLPSLSIGWILVIALLLRLPLLGDSLWNDEAVTARMMQLPFDSLPDAILSDTHPPLYYLALHSWTVIFGSSPFMLRMPSVLLSLLCIYLAYRLACDLKLGYRAGLWSAALVAVLPASILYGTEARSYMLLTALVMGALIFILEDRPVEFGAVLAALLWTHNVGLLYVAGLIAAYCVYRWQERRRWLLPIVIGSALGVLWFPTLWLQSQSVADGFRAYFSAGAVVRSFFEMSVGSISVWLVIPLTMITVFGLWRLRLWLRSPHGLTWLAVVLIPMFLSIVISLVWQPLIMFRYFLPAVMVFIVVWGYVLSRSRFSVALMTPVLFLSLVGFYSSGVSRARPDYRGLIAEHCAGADSFYATSINSAFITLANDQRPVLVSRVAADNGLVLTQAALPHFGMTAGNLSELQGQTVCIMQIDRPESNRVERVYLSLLRELYPVVTTQVHLGQWNDLYFHMVEL